MTQITIVHFRITQWDTEHNEKLQAVTIWKKNMEHCRTLQGNIEHYRQNAGSHNVTQNTTAHCRLSKCDKKYSILQAVTMCLRTIWNTAGCHNVTEHNRTLQAVTTWHRTLLNTAGCHIVTRNIIEHCRLSQCDAEHCSLSQCDTEHFRTLRALTMWHRTLYSTALCHNVTHNTIDHFRLTQCDTEY